MTYSQSSSGIDSEINMAFETNKRINELIYECNQCTKLGMIEQWFLTCEAVQSEADSYFKEDERTEVNRINQECQKKTNEFIQAKSSQKENMPIQKLNLAYGEARKKLLEYDRLLRRILTDHGVLTKKSQDANKVIFH